MAKPTSNTPEITPAATEKGAPVAPTFKTAFWREFWAKRDKVHQAKAENPSPHRSFRRSYREDYERELKAPGLWQHAASTFKVLLVNWKLFCGLLVVAMILSTVLIGVISEDTYVKFQELLSSRGDLGKFATSGLLLFATISSGGFAGGLSETQAIFTIVIFMIIWLVTIYLLRQLASGHSPRLRDGLFNALAPLLSTLVIAVVIIFDLLPIGLFVVTLSAAVNTHLLATPLYTLLFFAFAFLMILLSLYLLSGSVLALVAVSAPGMYPLTALHEARVLISGRRIRFVTRLLFGLFVIALAVCLIMIPLILLDLGLKSSFPGLAGLPFIPACLLTLTCAVFIYFSAYIYLYYRRLLEND